MSGPTEETVTLRRVEGFTRTVGPGRDVVVLHGGPGAHHDCLLPQYDTLATKRRLRYYDQPGGGRSVTPRRSIHVGQSWAGGWPPRTGVASSGCLGDARFVTFRHPGLTPHAEEPRRFLEVPDSLPPPS